VSAKSLIPRPSRRFPLITIPNPKTGVPQRSDLSPDFYNIYTAYIPNSENTLIAIYADDTAIFSSHSDTARAYQNLQINLDNISKYSKFNQISLFTSFSI